MAFQCGVCLKVEKDQGGEVMGGNIVGGSIAGLYRIFLMDVVLMIL